MLVIQIKVIKNGEIGPITFKIVKTMAKQNCQRPQRPAPPPEINH